MPERQTRLNTLRQRAKAAATRGGKKADSLDTSAAQEIHSLIEDLHLYQTELEVQNQELIEAQAQSSAALGEYTTLFDGMPVPAIVVDERFQILESNRMAIALLGLDKRLASRAVSLLTLLQEDSRPVFYAAARDQPSGKSVHLGNLQILTRSAPDPIPVSIDFVRFGTGGEHSEHILVLFQDRTANVDLDRVRRLFQSMLDNATSPMYAFDPEGRCLLANSAMLADIGKPREQIVGHTRHEWMSLADVVKAHNAELRQIQLELHLASEVLARSAEGVVITDASNQIVSVNKAYEQITGYSRDELIGRNPTIVQSGRHGQPFYEQLWRTLTTKNLWTGEMWNRRKNGELYPQDTRIIRILDPDGNVTNYAALALDITDRKAAQAEVELLAYYDPLTGAPTRTLILDRIAQAIRASNRSGEEFCVLYLDLDDFKGVNDSLGHEAGDLLLATVYDRLRANLRACDTVGRLAGDEFVVILQVANRDGAATVATKIREALGAPFDLDGDSVQTTVSVGISVYPHDGRSSAELLRNADAALYDVKRSGRDAWRFFDAELSRAQHRRLSIGRGLRDALANDELQLFYQPQISLADTSLIGVEVLLRWNNERLGNPGPAEFITVAESNGTIIAIGDWVLRTALAQMAQWRSAGMKPINLAVNVSGRQFSQPHFARTVHALLASFDWPAERLELEITENWAMRQPEASAAIMQSLHQSGIRFALDDFGTGYSSLSHLRLYPIDTIKIDRTFISQLGIEPDSETLVQSVIALARSLGMRCVAEGVETATQVDFLQALGCHAVQGYLQAEPMPAEKFCAWAADHS